MDIAGAINGFTKFTETMGAVMGAAEAITPAIYAVDGAINQVASVFTGDQYNPYPYPAYPVYPPMPVGMLNEGKVGIIGSMLAGGAAGALTHKGTSEAIKSIKAGAGSAGYKALGMSALKAGGIGAAVTGVISAAKNMSLVSKGMQTGSDAAGQISADTVGGLLAGATGGLAAGAASMALSGAVPGGGLMLTIGTAVAGALGATGAHLAYNATGLRDGVANMVRGMVGGNTNNQYQQPGYGQQQPGYGYQQPNYGYQQPNYGYGY